MPVIMHLNQQTHGVDILTYSPVISLMIGGTVKRVKRLGIHIPANLVLSRQPLVASINERQFVFHVFLDESRINLRINGRTFRVDIEDYRSSRNKNTNECNELAAEMPGALVEIRVVTGQAVEKGDIIGTIESMKLQMQLHAPRAGIIEALPVKINEPFDTGAVLAVLKSNNGA
ncbi:acetyl-CoA carboxylase biotin carboxyl carrier protein subunit [Castellaniella sp.]|uniref:acetyl-CoA carboxylase biotin carboxyl carrier protein subunit n=1 Tax=Castellaniella sp. TaxID=1955812 RepID=UPI0035601C82